MMRNRKDSAFTQDLLGISLPPLDILQGRSILITGATGLIGSALTELLLLRTSGTEIYAGCRSKERFEKRFSIYSRNRNLKFFRLDVTLPITADIKFDYIIHAASNASPGSYATDPVGTMKGNIIGTANLLDYGTKSGLKKFLYISSGEVYGKDCPEKWHETDCGYVDNMAVRSCYPASKRAAETLCVAYSDQTGIETCVARLCHTYGACFTETDNRAYAQFLRNVINGEDIILKSKGDQLRSWIYVADCAAALLYILVRGKSCTAYNVADENSEATIADMAHAIAGISGKSVIFDLPAEEEKKGYTPITKAIFSTERLRGLGWNAEFDIKTGLEHTLSTLRQCR